MSTTDNRKNWDKLKAELNKLQNTVVAVGILEGSKTQEGASQAEVAAVHEYGSVNRNGARIPERSFIRSWSMNNAAKINQFIEHTMDLVKTGRLTADQALKRLGVFAKGGIQMRIREITQPPLAESTIRAKQSSKPLIDTGTMLRSVNYVIRGKGEDKK